MDFVPERPLLRPQLTWNPVQWRRDPGHIGYVFHDVLELGQGESLVSGYFWFYVVVTFCFDLLTTGSWYFFDAYLQIRYLRWTAKEVNEGAKLDEAGLRGWMLRGRGESRSQWPRRLPPYPLTRGRAGVSTGMRCCRDLPVSKNGSLLFIFYKLNLNINRKAGSRMKPHV